MGAPGGNVRPQSTAGLNGRLQLPCCKWSDVGSHRGSQLQSNEALAHVVAIGASAGGLDALEQLVDGLPCDTGATFVVVQHLLPDHKSTMANLLSLGLDSKVGC